MTSKTTEQTGKGRWFHSMRFIVTAVTVGLITASILGIGLLNERSTRSSLTEEVQGRLLLEARNLAYLSTDALLSDYPELILQPMVNEIANELPTGSFVVIADHGGNIRGHVDSRELGRKFDAPAGLEAIEGNTVLRPDESLLRNTDIMVAVSPASYNKGEPVGAAYVGMPRDYLDNRLAEARRSQFLLLGALLFTGTLLALLLMSRLLKPLGIIVRGLDRIGEGDFGTTIELKARTELGTLVRHINNMVTKLRVAQEEIVQRERLSHEMDLARSIQKSLLPDSERIFGKYTIHGDHVPAQEVGGDFYDIFELPDDKVGLVIADVAGKGLAGCLATSMLAAFLRAYRETFASPVDLLNQLDNQLSKSLPRGTFVTMFYGILDLDHGHLTFASAGHIPPLIFRADRQDVEWLRTRGIPLAMVRDEKKRPVRQELVTSIQPSDVLVQMTDGINEAWNEDRSKQFGFDRVEEVVKKAAPRGGRSVLITLKEAVEAWTGWQSKADDETLLVIGRRVKEVGNTGSDILAKPEEHLNPEDYLDQACATGIPLLLEPSLDSLSLIHDWLNNCPIVKDSPKEELGIVSAALVDACANIIEHGGHTAEDGNISLYWCHRLGDEDEEYDPENAMFDEEIWRASQVVRGYFVICDKGNPFDPRNWTPTNLSKFKKSGRGMGLNIINSTMWRIQYQPSTSNGNVTVLHYHPVKHWMKEEVFDV